MPPSWPKTRGPAILLMTWSTRGRASGTWMEVLHSTRVRIRTPIPFINHKIIESHETADPVKKEPALIILFKSKIKFKAII